MCVIVVGWKTIWWAKLFLMKTVFSLLTAYSQGGLIERTERQPIGTKQTTWGDLVIVTWVKHANDVDEWFNYIKTKHVHFLTKTVW